MKEIQELFQQTLNRDLIQMTLSGAIDPIRAEKVKVRPVLIRDKLLFQETLYRGTQVFHTNFDGEKLAVRLADYMGTLFRQAQDQQRRSGGMRPDQQKGQGDCKTAA